MTELVVDRPVAGIPVRVSNLQAATQWVVEAAANGPRHPVDVHLANAYTIALADQEQGFRKTLLDAAAVFPDGKPMVWLTKLTRRPLQQVRGPSLFESVMAAGRARGLRHFLLGATDETLSLLQSALERRHPGVRIVGSYSPPFRTLDEDELQAQDELIRSTGAQIVWVGLGTPKQDFEAQRIAHSLQTVAVAVGAAFDFSAGTKPEAPAWMSRFGIEWVHRLASEPRRLWKRYLLGNTRFLWSVWSRRNEGSHSRLSSPAVGLDKAEGVA